jgi:hypothetical protein
MFQSSNEFAGPRKVFTFEGAVKSERTNSKKLLCLKVEERTE